MHGTRVYVLALAIMGSLGCNNEVVSSDGLTPPNPTAPTIPEETVTATSCAVDAVKVEAVPAFLQREMTVTLTDPAPVFVACSPDDDPSETLLAESSDASTTHTLGIHGLYSGTTWACEVVPQCADATAAVTEIVMPPADANAPSFTRSGSGDPDGPWTLFNYGIGGASGQSLLVVDPEGRLRWALVLDDPYELDMDASWTGDHFHFGGGWGLFDENAPVYGLMRKVDRAGRVIDERTQVEFGLGYNHHSEVMPDGQILSLTTSRDEGDGRSWYGVAVERLDLETNTVTYSWSSQTLFDSGTVGAPGIFNSSPWVANSIRYRTDALGDALWISLYSGAAIWRIDRDTGARTHVLGADGDFTWLTESGEPLPSRDWIYRQHDPDYTDDGRVLVYDNGVGRPGGDSSRVAEFQLDLEKRTATLLWSWTEPGWYTPIVGDADYLPSGRVLIAKGVFRFLTPFSGQRSALVEVDPKTDQVVWRLDFDDPSVAVFRAQRYDGCSIFASAKHCPAVADRLAALRAP